MMSVTPSSLARRRCTPCEGGVAPLSDEQIVPLLRGLSGWAREGAKIAKDYRFGNHHEAMAFVNAVAWISHREDHHPVATVDYNTVRIEYWTHAIGGLSENDFICAAKVDSLFEL